MNSTPISVPTGHEEWITVGEACALVGVSSATLRRWNNAGRIRALTTPGGHRRFQKSAVLGLVSTTGRRNPLPRSETEILCDHGWQIVGALIDAIGAPTPEERGRAVECFVRLRSGFVCDLGALVRRRGLDSGENRALIDAATEALDLVLSAMTGGRDGTIAASRLREVVAP